MRDDDIDQDETSDIQMRDEDETTQRTPSQRPPVPRSSPAGPEESEAVASGDADLADDGSAPAIAPAESDLYAEAVKRLSIPIGASESGSIESVPAGSVFSAPPSLPAAPAVPPPMPNRSSVPPPIPLVAKTRRTSSSAGNHTVSAHHVEFAKTLESQISSGAHGSRLARLLVELGRVTEIYLQDLPSATFHYQRAMRASPDLFAAVQGARVTLGALGRFEEAVPLFDAEARLLSSPRQKASLLYEKGRVLEQQLGDIPRAAEAYQAAHDLDRQNALVIGTLARFAEATGKDHQADKKELDRRFEQLATLAKNDLPTRAVFSLQRAMLAESDDQREAAIAFYESALQDDPDADIALEALDRLYGQSERSRERAAILVRRASKTIVPQRRAHLMLEAGRLLEQVGNEGDAHQHYLNALQTAPDFPPALESVAKSALVVQDWRLASQTLAAIAIHQEFGTTERARAYAQRGKLLEDRLNDREQAITALRASLELQFARETLTSLRDVLERDGRWADVIALTRLDVDKTTDRNVQAELLGEAARLAETNLQDAQQATELHRRAMTLAPGTVSSFRALRRLLGAQEKWRDLVQIVESHLDHTEGQSEQVALLLDIANVYETNIGDLSMASHSYARVLQVEEGNMSAIVGLQRVAEQDEQWEALLDALDKEAGCVYAPAKLTQILHQGAAVAENKLGDRKTALLWLKRALAVDAAHQPTLQAIARVAEATGRWEDRIEALQSLADATQGDERAHFLTAISRTAGEKLGDEEAAIRSAQASVEAAPSRREPFEHLYQILEQAQRWEELASAIESRIERCPEESDTARLALELGRLHLHVLENDAKAKEAFEHARSIAASDLGTWRTLEQLYEGHHSWVRVEALLHEAVIENAAKLEDDHRITLAARGCFVSSEKLGDLKRAAEYLDVGLGLDPDDSLLLHLRTRINALSSDTSTSLMSHTALAEQIDQPSLATAHLHEAAYLCVGHAAVVTVSEQILQADPSDTLAGQRLRSCAAQTGDLHRLRAASTSLANSGGDELSRSLHLVTTGEIHEQLGDVDQSLEAYRRALNEDADNLAAVRGISRVARLRDDPLLLAEAARCAAKAATDPSEAAGLLTRSAHVRVQRLADVDGARLDLERALELAPGHEEATEALVSLLQSSDDRKDLIQLLSRSATSTKEPVVQRSLWLRIADLQEGSNNRAGAISALSRVLRIQPDDADALLRLAALYAADKQWTESVNLLNQVIRTRPDRAALQHAHVELARIWHNHLGDSDRARVSLRAVLALDPYNMKALSDLVRLHCDEGDSEEARELAERLLKNADSDQEKANAHLLLSEVEQIAKNRKPALTHALHAVEISGSAGPAGEVVQRLAAARVHWEAYGNALSRYIELHAQDTPPPEDAVITLTDLWWERLENPKQALKVFKMTLGFADTERVRMAYARRLFEADHKGTAKRVLKELLARSVDVPDAWRLLGQIQQGEAGRYAQRVCLEIVRGLGKDTAADAELLVGAPPREIPGVVAHERAWLMHFSEGGPDATLREILKLIAPAMPKLFQTRFEDYNLTARGDAKTQSAIALCDALCVLLDIDSIELRFHDVRGQGPSFGFGKPATLFLPHMAMQWKRSELCFHLSRWLVAHRLGLAPVLRLSTHEVQTLIVSTIRLHDKTYGSGTNSEELLNKQSRTIGRAIGRKGRKRAIELAMSLEDGKRLLYEDWCQQMTRTCERIAAVLCDNLAVALSLAPGEQEALLRFWTSTSAEKLRTAVGFSE